MQQKDYCVKEMDTAFKRKMYSDLSFTFYHSDLSFTNQLLHKLERLGFSWFCFLMTPIALP